MSKMYVDMNELENLFAKHDIPYTNIYDELHKYSANEVADTLPVSELSEVLDRKDEVFATQIWQRSDVHTALRSLGCYNADSELVNAVMADAEDPLEDCSDNWERLCSIAQSCILKKGV